MDLTRFQEAMRSTYGARDRARGVPASIAWLVEEVGELAQAVRKGTPDEQLHELGLPQAHRLTAGPMPAPER